MTDVLTTEQRRRCMARIRRKDTDPERHVRSMIHRMGFRYRLNVTSLPGKPDIVLPRLRKVVLVHGCFWHMHRCKYGRVKPATNAGFWKAKREENRRRDARVRRALRIAGWDVLIVWECELRDGDKLRKRIHAFLSVTPRAMSSQQSHGVLRRVRRGFAGVHS
ncbi:MAG: DNA mismatch endonuclease Vsr [Planctomycetota bacterium]